MDAQHAEEEAEQERHPKVFVTGTLHGGILSHDLSGIYRVATS
jgi:hypothetical protein